ncbi:MAG: hypothetical protein R3F14_07930 [Polyangiaceae bacterium]
MKRREAVPCPSHDMKPYQGGHQGGGKRFGALLIHLGVLFGVDFEDFQVVAVVVEEARDLCRARRR